MQESIRIRHSDSTSGCEWIEPPAFSGERAELHFVEWGHLVLRAAFHRHSFVWGGFLRPYSEPDLCMLQESVNLPIRSSIPNTSGIGTDRPEF